MQVRVSAEMGVAMWNKSACILQLFINPRYILVFVAGCIAQVATALTINAGSGTLNGYALDAKNLQNIEWSRYYSSRLHAWQHNFGVRLVSMGANAPIVAAPQLTLGGVEQTTDSIMPVSILEKAVSCVKVVYPLSATYQIPDFITCAPVLGLANNASIISYVDDTRQSRDFDGVSYLPLNKQDNDKLTKTATGWELWLSQENLRETFDNNGRLLTRQFSNGVLLKLTYFPDTGSGVYPANAPTCGKAQTSGFIAGTLACVTDPYGRQLTFIQNAGRITQVIDPSNNRIQYNYGEATANAASDALTSVIWPDGKKRIYHYNEPAQLDNIRGWGLLTGITDENGNRIASYRYDNQGRAISAQHPDGINKYTVDYSQTQPLSTDALGATYQYTTTDPSEGIRRYGSVTRSCPTCAPTTVTNTYDSAGNLTSRTDFNGMVTNYTYDTVRNLETKRVEAVGKPEQRTISTAWHPLLSLPSKMAEPKKLTTYVYNGDKVGTTTVTCSPNPQAYVLCKQTEQATNDLNGAQGLTPTLTTGVAAKVWAYTYNANGQVLTVDGPQAGTTDKTTYAYYPSTDASGNWTQGDLQSITNAKGHVTQFTRYNPHGQVLEIIDPNGLITRYTYDARQRLTSRTLGSATELAANQGLLTQYQYDSAGQLTQLIAPNRSVINYTYDTAHRLTQIADALGNKLTFTLDAMGNRLKHDLQDPNGVLTQTHRREYNALNRLAKDIGAQNQTTQYQYDNNGNLTQITDPLNRIRTQQYDSLNRLIAQLAPALTSGPNSGQQATTRYTYDGLDQLTQVQDPRNLATTYTRNGLGQTTQQQSPDTGSTVNTYDAAGNLLTQTDAKAQKTTYTYDVLNRLTSIKYADNSTVTYTYDAFNNTSTTAPNYGKGRLTTLTEKNAAGTVLRTLNYRYDIYGRLLEDQRLLAGKTYRTRYTYGTVANTTGQSGAIGQLLAITYPSGRIVNYRYDVLGRINQVTTQASSTAAVQTLASNIQYQGLGATNSSLISLTYGNGQRYQRSLDQDGRIASYTQGGTTTGTNPALYQLTWDAANRITAIDQLLPTNQLGQAIATYGYDQLDRLTQITPKLATNPRITYQYDLTGNRTQRQAISTGSTSIQSSVIAAASNRLQTLNGLTQTYDANGNQLTDGTVTRTYDSKNRLSQANNGAQTITYELNALGQRIRKVGSNLTQTPDTLYHYNQRGQLIAESPTATGTTIPGPSKEYIWLGDIPLAVISQ